MTMFRTYRDPDYNLFYPLLIGIAALWLLCRFVQREVSSEYSLPQEYYQPAAGY